MKQKIFIVLLCGLSFITFKGYAQSTNNEGVVSMAGAELGIRTGVFYEQRLSHAFSLIGSLGYEARMGATLHSGFSHTGVRPVMALASRWYMNIPDNNSQNNVPYIAFELSYSPEMGAFLLPKDLVKREKWDVIALLAFGYRHSLSERFILKGQAGLSLGYSKLHQEQGLFDVKDWKGKNEIMFDLGIIYKF